MSLQVGIAGAGLLGRLLAIACIEKGYTVSLFDKDSPLGSQSCGYIAAGMLAPLTELETAEPLIADLGLQALGSWRELLTSLNIPQAFQQAGTLLLAHPEDSAELQGCLRRIEKKRLRLRTNSANLEIKPQDRAALEDKLPGLANRIHQGYHLSPEGQVDGALFYQASSQYLSKRLKNWHSESAVEALRPGSIDTQQSSFQFDQVFDCRGLGAKADWPGLRGVRGELLYLESQSLQLACPVRILHPRYPLYLSPRGGQRFVLGATSIETEDQSPISVLSMLELLSAAYSLHPALAEARLLAHYSAARPCLEDHLPKIWDQNGLIRVNGLYRHGYLLGPALVQELLRYLDGGVGSMAFPELLQRTEGQSNDEYSP